MLTERRATYCAQLKYAREKSGVSLEQIAASTKISRALFTDLERNDLSRWPKGIYRRSYLRAYLTAIDLSPESMLAEFVLLFPDDKADPGTAGHQLDEPCGLSMTLAEGPEEAIARARKRLIAAAIDTGIVCVVCAVAAWVTQADIRSIGLVVVFGYYSIATTALGRSPGCQWLDHRRWKSTARMRSHSARRDTLLAPLDSIAKLPEPGRAVPDAESVQDDAAAVFDLLQLPNSAGQS